MASITPLCFNEFILYHIDIESINPLSIIEYHQQLVDSNSYIAGLS